MPLYWRKAPVIADAVMTSRSCIDMEEAPAKVEAFLGLPDGKIRIRRLVGALWKGDMVGKQFE
jgi:hypothetical protein